MDWCFWTVVLEKTLESLGLSLDCKEIKPVNPKENQSWIFIGKTDAEAETNTLATWCEELTHWKRPWWWERLLFSCVWLFVNPWTAARQACLCFTISQSLLKLMSIELVLSSNHLSLCHPLSSCLQYFPVSGSFLMSQFFASNGQSISFSFSISLSNKYSGLISFRIDWFDLLTVQGTRKSILQHHS